MAADADALKQLRKMCEIDVPSAQAALKKSGGDAEKALHALIVEGHLDYTELDPSLCADEHFALAKLRDTILRRQEDSEGNKQWEKKRPTKDLLQQLSGKKPLDKETMSSGKMFRELYLQRKYPELVKKTPPAIWKHPKLGEFSCQYGEVSGTVAMPGMFNNGKRSPKVALSIYVRKNDKEPAKEQVDLVLNVQKNAKALAKKICRALWEDFQGKGRKTGMWWHGNLAEVNRDLNRPIRREADLPGMLKLSSMMVNKGADKKPVMVLNFHAPFEDEHGVGVLTDGKTVLGIGYASDVMPYK